MVVLEDAHEALLGDREGSVGQGLSRLLNLTDGLVAQGFRAIVLLTTNDPLSVVHPAAIRPGRCLAEIKFGVTRDHGRASASRQ